MPVHVEPFHADVVEVDVPVGVLHPRAGAAGQDERRAADGAEGFERGRRLAKMGLKSQDTAELFFNDCRVPKANVLGGIGQGFRYLTRFLAQERLVTACAFMGTAQAAFDLTLDFVKDRRAFGRPIGTFQNSRFKMAEMRVQLDMSQTYVDQCVLLHNAGALSAEDAAGAKLASSEIEGRVIDVLEGRPVDYMEIDGAGAHELHRIAVQIRAAVVGQGRKRLHVVAMAAVVVEPRD